MIEIGKPWLIGRRSIRWFPSIRSRQIRVLGTISAALVMVVLSRQAPSAIAQTDDDADASPTKQQASPTVRLIPEDLLLPEGFGTIDLTVENIPAVQTITIWLYLDPARFAVTSITRGPLLAASGASLAHEITDGYLTLRATFEPMSAEEENVVGDGAIARIGIAALQAGSGEIEFDGLELLDSDGGEIDARSEGVVAVEAESEPGPEAIQDVAAQATALAESAVLGGLPDAARRGIRASIVRSVGNLGPKAAWLALLAAAAGITGIAWLVGRENESSTPLWTTDIGPDEHRRSML